MSIQQMTQEILSGLATLPPEKISLVREYVASLQTNESSKNDGWTDEEKEFVAMGTMLWEQRENEGQP